MSNTDNRPSISELQQREQQNRKYIGAPEGADARLLLFEIARTGLAWAEAEDALGSVQPGAGHRGIAAMHATRAFDAHRAALARVKP